MKTRRMSDISCVPARQIGPVLLTELGEFLVFVKSEIFEMTEARFDRRTGSAVDGHWFLNNHK